MVIVRGLLGVGAFGVTHVSPCAVLTLTQVSDLMVARAEGSLGHRGARYILSELSKWVRRASESGGVTTIPATNLSGITRDFIRDLGRKFKPIHSVIAHFLLQAIKEDPTKKLRFRQRGGRNTYQLNIGTA